MICLSLGGESMAAALQGMAACPPTAALIELRLDLIADLDLTELLRAKTRPVIVTNRRREEGGRFAGTEEQRIDLLCQAAGSGADYLDLEAATDDKLAERLFSAAAAGKGGKRPRIIVSWHDWRGTPGVDALRRRWRACREKGGDIVKVVTLARRPEDNLRILSLIPYSRRRGREIIAFAMGEQGRSSRIVSLLLGAYLAYATAARGRETAPGQFICEEMSTALNLLAPPGWNMRRP